MSDSYIELNENGDISAYVGEDATRLFQARILHSGLKARKMGIQLARNYTPKRLFEAASRFTGKKYKITEYDLAMKDLDQWIKTMEAALPVIQRKETVLPSTPSSR